MVNPLNHLWMGLLWPVNGVKQLVVLCDKVDEKASVEMARPRARAKELGRGRMASGEHRWRWADFSYNLAPYEPRILG